MIMIMDIGSPRGTKVVFAHPTNGYSGDQETANKHLAVGGTYTVARTDVGKWITYVYLLEVPGIPFNSVHFDEAEEQPCK